MPLHEDEPEAYDEGHRSPEDEPKDSVIGSIRNFIRRRGCLLYLLAAIAGIVALAHHCDAKSTQEREAFHNCLKNYTPATGETSFSTFINPKKTDKCAPSAWTVFGADDNYRNLRHFFMDALSSGVIAPEFMECSVGAYIDFLNKIFPHAPQNYQPVKDAKANPNFASCFPSLDGMAVVDMSYLPDNLKKELQKRVESELKSRGLDIAEINKQLSALTGRNVDSLDILINYLASPVGPIMGSGITGSSGIGTGTGMGL